MVLNLPLDEFIDNTHIVTQEKRKIRKPKKGKKKDHLKNTSLGPLGKGNSSTHPRQNYAPAKSETTKQKLEKHMQAPPKPIQLPLDYCMQNT
jgi:hypothetical protein